MLSQNWSERWKYPTCSRCKYRCRAWCRMLYQLRGVDLFLISLHQLHQLHWKSKLFSTWPTQIALAMSPRSSLRGCCVCSRLTNRSPRASSASYLCRSVHHVSRPLHSPTHLINTFRSHDLIRRPSHQHLVLLLMLHQLHFPPRALSHASSAS